MEVLKYQPWQWRAALGRLLLGGGVLLLTLWVAFGMGPIPDLLLLFSAAFGGLYLWRTGVEPLRRAGLEVVLEPEGVRIGGRFYPRGAFRGVEGPRGRWAAYLLSHPAQPGLHRQGNPLAPSPLFHLDFGGERVPLWLDLPGWDRMLRHLGLDWTEHPGLSRYLSLVEGMGWLNGLLYPPQEAEEVWLRARRRYRRLMGLLWLGFGLMVLGFIGEIAQVHRVAEWVMVGFTLVGFLLAIYATGVVFGGRNLQGWGMRYNPLRALRDEELA